MIEFTEEELANEIWKDIPSVKMHLVSNLGRVKSLSRMVKIRNNGLRKIEECILKQLVNGVGYYYVQPFQQKKLNHRLVAEAFIRPMLAGEQVNHKDFNKLNNRIENLEICTPKENTQHALLGGRYEKIRKIMSDRCTGEMNPSAKLTEEDVINIRREYDTGTYTHGQLAKIYGVSRICIRFIIIGKTWKSIPLGRLLQARLPGHSAKSRKGLSIQALEILADDGGSLTPNCEKC